MTDHIIQGLADNDKVLGDLFDTSTHILQRSGTATGEIVREVLNQYIFSENRSREENVRSNYCKLYARKRAGKTGTTKLDQVISKIYGHS